LLTFVDRPKADASASIARLGALGITVKVITGDNPVVAAKVCRDLGLKVEQVHSGAELARLDDDALAAAIAATTVFARTSPTQQSRILKLARRGGADVAFLGDGVNDAVACTPPTSASRSTRPPTWPRTPPTSCCWTKTSACSPTA
jgi:Mg2+-importing ATPase